jgi:glycosyltransferase involved in cell wall biosynthesis
MTMRLVFLYTNLRAASCGCDRDWIREATLSSNPYAVNFWTEGIGWWIAELKNRGVIDDYIVFMESTISPGRYPLAYGSEFWTIPHMNDIAKYIRSDDVILARGGFRPWPPFLQAMNERKQWVLFYRANTHRGKWPYWDVVLDDLISAPARYGDRLHVDYVKPVTPSLFYPMPGLKRRWDIIVNASHIHEKKGQYKAIDAVASFKKNFGKDLSVYLPGGFYGGEGTRKIPEVIKKHSLKVALPGMVSRVELRKQYNQAKLYVHLGVGGQNDRGCLEAMACGLPVMLATPDRFAPFVSKNSEFCTVLPNVQNPQVVAQALADFLSRYDEKIHSRVRDYFVKENGEEVAVSRMTRLFSFLRSHPVADRKAILHEYGV